MTARRGPLARVAVGVAALLAFCVFLALGTWQVHRLAWKRDLIARVATRVDATPIAMPGSIFWPSLTTDIDAYRNVTAHGRFLTDRETLVQAVTAYGGGFWVLTPFRTDAGFTVLVNRGFVPPERRVPLSHAAPKADEPVTITGLLRMTEPGGAFLRANDPATGRWYSRDVAAIAAARGLHDVAPYFVDADATPNPSGYPVGGLTVVAFPNNHLVYAMTWFGLAAMLVGAVAWAIRDERRVRDRTI